MVQRALGSLDDAFFVAEAWFKEGGKKAGKTLGMTPEEIKKRNKLVKTVKELASKGKFTHSAVQRNIRFIKSFRKPLLDVKLKKLRRIEKRFPKHIQ